MVLADHIPLHTEMHMAMQFCSGLAYFGKVEHQHREAHAAKSHIANKTQPGRS
jgi:hypothetical protein